MIMMGIREELPKRLKETREHLRLSRQQLATQAGISTTALYYYEKGEQVPNAQILSRLSKELHVSTDYLLGNTDDPTPPTKIEDKVKLSGGSSAFSFEKIQLKPIPVYDGASAGKIGMFPNENEIVEYTTIPIDSPGKYGVIVHGNSMEPDISEKDIVIVDTEQDVPNGKKAVVSVDGGIFVKVLYRQNGTVTLVSLNPKYPPIIISSSEIPSYILGKVVAIIRKVS